MRSWNLVSNYGHHVGQTALIDDRRQASPLKMLALRIEGVWQRHCTDVPACHIGTTRAGVSFDSGKADTGHIEETIYSSCIHAACICPPPKHESGLNSPTLRYQWPEVVIVLPKKEAATWAESNQVGVYASVDLGPVGTLDLIVEKDFACLDVSDADNLDTFSNPNAGIC
jgi:hypothetical protein